MTAEDRWLTNLSFFRDHCRKDCNACSLRKKERKNCLETREAVKDCFVTISHKPSEWSDDDILTLVYKMPDVLWQDCTDISVGKYVYSQKKK